MIAALLLASLLSRQCIEIDDDRIQARHLRERVPEFQQLPADAVFGLAPRPGVRRLLPSYELSAFARKHLVSLTDAREFCMIRTSMVLSMTLAWDNLPDVRSGAQWTIRDALDHLSLRGRDPWAGYARSRQTLDGALKKLAPRR